MRCNDLVITKERVLNNDANQDNIETQRLDHNNLENLQLNQIKSKPYYQ